jgi:MerR family transcriptional regulator, copper efflux regulator
LSEDCDEKAKKLLRVGDLARATGKSVRAIHLYEELGLLRPSARSAGGFRLYRPSAVARIDWIAKLQAIGFSLSEIGGFIREFERSASAPEATARARRTFSDKLDEIRQSIARLRVIENDLVEALDYLESCRDCHGNFAPSECHHCDHQGHEVGDAPELFAGLSEAAVDDGDGYDVALDKLTREAGEAS